MVDINHNAIEKLKDVYPDFAYDTCNSIQLSVLGAFFNDLFLSYNQQFEKSKNFKLFIDLDSSGGMLKIHFVRKRENKNGENKTDLDFMTIVDTIGNFEGLMSMSEFYYESVYGHVNVCSQILRPFLMCKLLHVNFKRTNQRINFRGQLINNVIQFINVNINLKNKEKLVYTSIENNGLNIDKEFKYDKNFSFIFYRYKCQYENFYFDILSHQGLNSDRYEVVDQVYPNTRKNISLSICELLNTNTQSADNLTIDDISVALMLEV